MCGEFHIWPDLFIQKSNMPWIELKQGCTGTLMIVSTGYVSTVREIRLCSVNKVCYTYKEFASVSDYFE